MPFRAGMSAATSTARNAAQCLVKPIGHGVGGETAGHHHVETGPEKDADTGHARHERCPIPSAPRHRMAGSRPAMTDYGGGGIEPRTGTAEA